MPIEALPPATAQTITAVAASVAATVAALAAVASWRAVRANQKAFEGRLLSDLMGEYASEGMGEALDALGRYFRNPNVGRPEDGQRRRVSHYFQKVHRLREARLISERFARRAIDRGQAIFFLKMEQLERDIHREQIVRVPVDPTRFDETPFEFYAGLHGLKRSVG